MTIPDSVKKNLLDYLTDNTPISSSTEIWCRSVAILRPKYVMTLYRGLYFDGEHPDDNPGLDFLDGARQHDTINITSNRYTAWTSVRGVARRFSLNSDELTFSGMSRDFLKKYPQKHHPMGIVLSSQFKPSDILFSAERLARYFGVRGKYGREWEFIIDPLVDQLVHIEEIYTPEVLLNHTGKISTRSRVI